jgi:acyl transferase domain-containing protein/surfactin synthase thioesterase subunit/acyl carrier protein
MSGLHRNDIAIIGLSCRFPGAATADEYWKNLCEGVESITFFSDQELVAANIDQTLVADPSYVKAAPMLRNVEMFDASFFDYSPRDAALMDPQHRLFLEVCWETFENAGYDPAGYPGKIGVLCAGGGVVSSYLLSKLYHANLIGQTASTSHINNDKDFLSTRVSFKLNLRGPSFTIQSACSSSLVAVHQACQNLRFNECDMMLAGGSVVRVPQIAGYLAEKRNLYSLDGHCRPFDSLGQGTIFGSGVGAALLKPLERAVADRDHIFAVIKGTAVNNDGSAKISYTAPSVGQQSQAVIDALTSAEVSAESVGYVECHSTGTTVGDPLEIDALTMAFRNDTSRKQYCAIGSVKANIGHPEQAAGIAGLIKAALVLHHKRIPPSINYETPNPRIDFASSPFYVNTKLQNFPLTDTPRRAGLNSLGIGGTNAFAVLEEAPPTLATKNQPPGTFPCLATLSAKSADALVARVEQLLNWLNDNPDAPIADVCYTTNVSRSRFAFRFAAPARTTAELKGHLGVWLSTIAEGAPNPQRASNSPIAFMFSGQGSQSAGMAAELYCKCSVFRNALDQCHALADPYLERGLLEVIFAADSNDALVNRTDYTQPALFAVEYALTELVKSWGIVPHAVIGHSLGEIAAAYAADVLTLEDAMRLVIARGALMHRLPSGGAMAAIFAEESVVRGLINKVAPEITVAAMNGPLNTVVSGERDTLKILSTELDHQNISYKELHISNGFHSPRTEPILDDFENVAGSIKYNAPRLLLVSNLTGELMSVAPDKTYWRRHLREAVRFGNGMLALDEVGCRTFLEIGPHPALLPMAQVCLGARGRSAAWVATLNRQKSDVESVTEMLVALYLAGHHVNWTAVHADASWRRIPLPTYPFQRQRYWIDNEKAHTERTQNSIERSHPLVGTRINSPTNDECYEARYGKQYAGYFSDHKVKGTVVLPTAAELEAATIVGRIHFGTPRVSFDDAMHHQAMSFTNVESRIVRMLVGPLKSDKASFRLFSASSEDPEAWTTHMTGILRKSDALPSQTFSTKQVRARCRKMLPVGNLYEQLYQVGLEYGQSFRGIRELYLGQHEALTKVRLPHGLTNTQYAMHPAFLDACLHVYPLVLDSAKQVGRESRNSYLPVSLSAFRCYQDGVDEAWVHTKLRNVEKDDTQVVDIQVYDTAERPVAELDGLAVRLLPLEKVLPPQIDTDGLFYRAAWQRSVRTTATPEENRAPASWVIFADAKGVGAAMADKLDAEGHCCHLVYRDELFSQLGRRNWTVNERRPHDFCRLLEQVATSDPPPCAGVVYLWGLDAPTINDLTLSSLKIGSEMMCRGALAILQACAETRSTETPGRRLWFVTENTQKTEGQGRYIDPVQAPLWGLGRTIAIEYPSIWGGLIDLQLNDGEMPDIDSLTQELLHQSGEPLVAISTNGQRHIQRLVKRPLAQVPTQPPPVRGDASYLVTGGLGMLGRGVAQWLISKGAKHLVLTGRNASNEAAKELFSAAEVSSTTIRVIAADISCHEDVSRLMQTIRNELPPLKGVVHSAGVLDDGILAQLNWDRFAPLFEPRVYGSWLLHEATKSLGLDFFILESSLLSLLGSAGQGNYTASSAFLDSLAAHRRATGLPATTINWSAWSGGGLATISGVRGEAIWSSLGVKFISPDLAMQAFDKLMHHDVDQIAVAIVDWPTYAGKVGKPPFLAELLNGRQDFGSPKSTRSRCPAPPSKPANDEPRQQLLIGLQQCIMAELGFVNPVDPDQPLNEIGLDSLRSVALANKLEDEFGILISISELISGPTINQLVDHLFDLFERNGKDEAAGSDLTMMSAAAIGTFLESTPKGATHTNSPADSAARRERRSLSGQPGSTSNQLAGWMGPLQVDGDHLSHGAAINPAKKRNGLQDYLDFGVDEKTFRNGGGAGTENLGTAFFRPAVEVVSRPAGRWLVSPRPNPTAKARLFCFPYAGGGLASFRALAQLFDSTVEVVAVEPPGRGSRINEPAVDDLDVFVEGLLPELIDWLDRPSAFFGHCLGGLTMFATLCALPEECARFVKHAFPCGVRPPHLLKRRGAFEDNAVYSMMLHREFDVRVPFYAQADEIVADIIRQFDTQAANKMLEMPKLRQALLPTIRAEFGMAFKYEYQPTELFSFPISSFVGDLDPWVSETDSAGWSELTRGPFANHLRKGSHFLMADDGQYIAESINKEFVNSANQ